jgi:putative ABC transport system substrate-binding protein
MIARRRLLAGAAALLPAVGAAQTGGRRHRVVYLSGGTISARRIWIDALLEGLAEFGYRRGENLDFEAIGADGRFERLPALAAEVVAREPDVIVTSTTPGVLAAMAATDRIPIVMATQGDPLGQGIVKSLSRPEGNVTGLSNGIVDLAGKRVELLHELVPGARRIAALINPGDPLTQGQLASAHAAATAMGIELSPIVELRGSSDAAPAIAAATAGGAEAAIRLVDPLSQSVRPALQQAAARNRLPVIFAFREDVEAGGLIAYGTNQQQLYRQSARHVHRLLQGARPSDLPVELPTTFELFLNRSAAAALGIELPATLLARADEVIE